MYVKELLRKLLYINEQCKETENIHSLNADIYVCEYVYMHECVCLSVYIYI